MFTDYGGESPPGPYSFNINIPEHIKHYIYSIKYLPV